MNSITVITPTIGRKSIRKLIESLSKQGVKITHLILWDNKREDCGYQPNDTRLSQCENENYNIFHYVITHPVVIKRKDNYLRTIGIMMANTNFITQLDDDCWIENDWLDRAMSQLINLDKDCCFCRRRLWEDEKTSIGIDNYESIGVVNKFGYNLIETNSLVFRKNVSDKICSITHLHNSYGHDRELARFLIDNASGINDNEVGLNQIVPDFLVNFHKKEIKLQEAQSEMQKTQSEMQETKLEMQKYYNFL